MSGDWGARDKPKDGFRSPRVTILCAFLPSSGPLSSPYSSMRSCGQGPFPVSRLALGLGSMI